MAMQRSQTHVESPRRKPPRFSLAEHYTDEAQKFSLLKTQSSFFKPTFANFQRQVITQREIDRRINPYAFKQNELDFQKTYDEARSAKETLFTPLVQCPTPATKYRPTTHTQRRINAMTQFKQEPFNLNFSNIVSESLLIQSDPEIQLLSQKRNEDRIQLLQESQAQAELPQQFFPHNNVKYKSASGSINTYKLNANSVRSRSKARLYAQSGTQAPIAKFLNLQGASSQASTKSRCLQQNKQQNYGPFFTATLSKTQNKPEIISDLKKLSKQPQAKVHQIRKLLAHKQPEPLKVDEILRLTEDRYVEAIRQSEKQEIIVWKDETDQEFLNYLIKPNSRLYGDRRRSKQLGEGTTLDDKIMMLSLVDEVYGGDQDYLRSLLEQQLRKEIGAREIDKLREFRRKRKAQDEERWRKMYQK